MLGRTDSFLQCPLPIVLSTVRQNSQNPHFAFLPGPETGVCQGVCYTVTFADVTMALNQRNGYLTRDGRRNG